VSAVEGEPHRLCAASLAAGLWRNDRRPEAGLEPHLLCGPEPGGAQPPGSAKRTCMWFSWFAYGTTTPPGPRRPDE
jgi:hypothetical protein